MTVEVRRPRRGHPAVKTCVSLGLVVANGISQQISGCLFRCPLPEYCFRPAQSKTPAHSRQESRRSHTRPIQFFVMHFRFMSIPVLGSVESDIERTLQSHPQSQRERHRAGAPTRAPVRSISPRLSTAIRPRARSFAANDRPAGNGQEATVAGLPGRRLCRRFRTMCKPRLIQSWSGWALCPIRAR